MTSTKSLARTLWRRGPVALPFVGPALRVFVRAVERPWIGAAFAALVYGLVALRHPGGFSLSAYPYFNWLADAFLHGQLSLIGEPPITHDLSLFEGHWYLYWPPFPAVVMLPFVAAFGAGVSDIAVTVLLGAVNVALVSLLLRASVRRRLVRLSRESRGWLVLLFAFGTVHFTLAPFGRVWFTAQVVGFGCLAVAYLAALRLRGACAFALASAAVGAAFLTRSHLVFAGLWPAAYLLWSHRELPRARLAGYVVVGLVPLAAALSIYLAYNALRFGHPLENGLRYHHMGSGFVADYEKYGAFSLHYVPINLYYQYLYYPLPIRPGYDMGGGLFWMTPPFLAAFVALWRARPRWSVALLASSCALVAIPILLLMGTGYVQFGPRYTLDFTVPLLLLVAMGLRRVPRGALAVGTIIAIVTYTHGALHFMRHL